MVPPPPEISSNGEGAARRGKGEHTNSLLASCATCLHRQTVHRLYWQTREAPGERPVYFIALAMGWRVKALGLRVVPGDADMA